MDSFQLHQDSNSIKTRDRTFLWCFVLLSFPFRAPRCLPGSRSSAPGCVAWRSPESLELGTGLAPWGTDPWALPSGGGSRPCGHPELPPEPGPALPPSDLFLFLFVPPPSESCAPAVRPALCPSGKETASPKWTGRSDTPRPPPSSFVSLVH